MFDAMSHVVARNFRAPLETEHDFAARVPMDPRVKAVAAMA
jgi:hypothetical protein